MKIRQKTNYVSTRSAELYSYSALKNFKENCDWNYPENPEEGKKDAQDFFNCIEEPLFNLPDESYIWDILPLLSTDSL